MSWPTDRAAEIAQALREAGLTATEDPRAATVPPVVLVHPMPTIDWREARLTGDLGLIRWQIVALAPGSGDLQAAADLARMTLAAVDVLDALGLDVRDSVPATYTLGPAGTAPSMPATITTAEELMP